MSRSRSQLHFNTLEEFKAWLIARGWEEQPTKGFYEVLRMRHKKEKEPLILHRKDSATQHFTSWGLSDKMVNSFLRSRRDEHVKKEEPVTAE
jgi:hypothetical protein